MKALPASTSAGGSVVTTNWVAGLAVIVERGGGRRDEIGRLASIV